MVPVIKISRYFKFYNLKKFVLANLFLLFFGHIISQQAIQYQIAAELNPEQKSLSVKTNIEIPNVKINSNDTIYFLAWENAIRNKNSYFHRRYLMLNSVDYYFDKNTELAGFHDLAKIKMGIRQNK